MPRRKIEYSPGAIYHIYNRGAGRQSIFYEDENYRYLLRLIKDSLAELQVTLLAYCLLPNHYHWLVRQDGEEAAGLLPRRVFNRYTKAFNRRYGRSGTLFEDRYRAILVDTDAYLRQLCLYIHANPVRHGLALAPDLWTYSNYLEWIGQRPGVIVDRAFVERSFGSPAEYARAVKRYLAAEVHIPEEIRDMLEQLP